jgi:PAS domain S-box-containing protein
MHRPQSPAESTPPLRLWLHAHGWQVLVLAVLYFLFGHASFLVQVDDVLVTPVLFAPEGIALAMALRFGAAVWPGVFAGQLALALSLGLAPWPSVSISAINSLEAVLAVFLFRAFKLDATLPRARDLAGLLLLVFLILQPFSATLGNATLWAGGIVERAELPASWLNWWIGNSFGQMLVAPLLLALFAGGRTKRQAAGDFFVPLLVIAPAFWAADYLLRWTGVPSLVGVFAPILVLLAIYRGLAAVCMGGLLVAVGALYATSHAFGPFVSQGRADIPGLNLFIIGLALSGQFLAVFLGQSRAQQKLADQLRDAREQLQRTAYELTENIPVGTYVLEFDAEGNPGFTFVSERWLKMLDLRRGDVLADHTLAVSAVHPDEREAFDRLNAEVHRERKRFFWEGRIVVHGETRWMTIESIPRPRPGGGTIWEGAMIDITDRKRAEAQLRRVLDNLPIAVAATTLTSPADLLFVNEQFTRTFGYTLQDVPTVAAWAEKAYPDPDYRRAVFGEWDEAVFRAIEVKGSVESMEFEVTGKDGTKRDIIFRAVVLDDRLLTSMTDVTEHKKAQAALRSLREELERTAFELTENIPVGTYTMVQPPDGGLAYFSFMSTRFLEITGLEPEAARTNPMNAFACVHPDDYDEWVRKNAYVFEHKLPFKEECRVVVEGETRWITAESTPRALADGSVVWEGVLTDITDRKLAEQKVADSEARLRKILDNIPIPVAINDATKDGRITFLNEAFTRTFGYTPEDVPDVGAWARLAYPEEDYRAATFRTWDSAVAEAVHTDGAVAPMEFRVNPKEGHRLDVIINAVALEDMLLVGFVDITARKTAEEQVTAANRNMQLAASAARLGFWELDVDTGLDRWDEEMARINGVALADFDGRWEKFVHPDDHDEVMRETRRMLESDEIFTMEYRIVRPSGEVRHVREHGLVTRDTAGRALRAHGVLQDITEEKEAAARLQESAQRERKLEEAHRRDLEAKLKTSLSASAVAHEINQPLSSILLQSKMALQEGEAGSETLQIIAQEAQRVVQTIDKMKTLLRNVQTDQREIDLAGVVQSALLYNKGLLAKHRIKLRRAGLDHPCRIMGDDAQLQLAITNLLRNAAESISEAKPKKRELALDLTVKGNSVELVLGDSGPGWPAGGPAEVPLTTTKKSGTGIGLYVVRTAMENHRGEIVFGRSPLGGAEVRLRFPHAEEKA